jgi:chorismate mutase
MVIAGPCSAESEVQVHETAAALAAAGRTSLLRAGIWKPRTRPGSFQGFGEEALPWLVDAGRAHGLPTTTEVANAHHVEMCLKAGVDVLWIGARTTVNPFSVQEIADALKGVDIPVIVKNPINPDLELWIGAIERLSNSGIQRIMAMHRGFSGLNTGGFRNAPLWEIPIALRTALPDLPIICDPSHITGDRSKLAIVAQKALDLGMIGLMIETHPRPDDALSDAAQQITPQALTELLEGLNIRSSAVENPLVENALAVLRSRIDELDNQIVRLLAQRMHVVGDIGAYKKEKGITILQVERWKEIMESRGHLGASLQLDETLLRQYLELIHASSIRLQSRIMNEGSDDVLW